MNQTGFAVSQFENRNGITSWRVAGWLHGVRIRKNFKTREEAEAVFRRLEGRTQSLGFYVDFALTNYRDPNRDISVADATKDYVAVREVDFKEGNLSKRQFVASATLSLQMKPIPRREFLKIGGAVGSGVVLGVRGLFGASAASRQPNSRFP